jgi:hypothetical protein
MHWKMLIVMLVALKTSHENMLMLTSLFMTTAGAIDAYFDDGYPRLVFYFIATANGLQNGISSTYCKYHLC